MENAADHTRHIAIAIDGPAASGKSSVARLLARKLGYLYVNSGALYRAVTWFFLHSDTPTDREEEVAGTLERMRIDCGTGDGVSTIRINDEDPGPHLSAEEVNRAVSAVSAIPAVRALLVEKLVAYRELGNLVMEGRDIGSVVFPETPHKFYIDASEEVRDRRRKKQGLRDQIRERDKRDSTRTASPLVVAENARVIDSSSMSIEEVVDEILEQLRSRGVA